MESVVEKYKECSFALLQLYKTKLVQLLNLSEMPECQKSDLLINLHMVLELGLNYFYSSLLPVLLIMKVDNHEDASKDHNERILLNDNIIRDIDSVSFLHKTIMFVYGSRFKMETLHDIQALPEHYKITDRIKKFNEKRNKLLHGHSIHTIHDVNRKVNSPARKMMDDKNINDQIEGFKSIMNSMSFFLMKLDFPSLTQEAREMYRELYLDTDFLQK